jgi:hypothetical protein
LATSGSTSAALTHNGLVPRLACALASFLVLLLPVSSSTSASAHRAPEDTVAVIGDSLTDQRDAGQARIEYALQNRGHGGRGIFFWGVGGKSLLAPDSLGTTTLQNIRAARAELGHVDTWVIALGTTERFSTRAEVRLGVRRVVSALGTDRFVWIGTGFYQADSQLSRRINAILVNNIAAAPNGRYANWNRYIHNPVRSSEDLWVFPQDRLHMTEKGYLLRARYYARTVD